jgi:hypothetical protein
VAKTFFPFVDRCEALHKARWESALRMTTYLSDGWRLLKPASVTLFAAHLYTGLSTPLVSFKNEARHAAWELSGNDERSAWGLTLAAFPPRPGEEDNFFLHSMAILEGGARMLPEFQIRLSGKQYVRSFLQSARYALGLDPMAALDRDEILEEIKQRTWGRSPWVLSGRFDEIPGEGLHITIYSVTTPDGGQPPPPLIKSLIEYVRRLFQVPKP